MGFGSTIEPKKRGSFYDSGKTYFALLLAVSLFIAGITTSALAADKKALVGGMLYKQNGQPIEAAIAHK